MPTIQGNFPIRQDAFTVGQAADSRYTSRYGVCVDAAGIAFGQPVARGTILTPIQGGGSLNDSLVNMATGRTFIGVSRRDAGRPAINGDKTPQGAPMSFFTSGHVAVIADAAVAVDAIVRWNSATGRYTSAAASGTVFELTGWTFDSVATAAGQIVIIKR